MHFYTLIFSTWFISQIRIFDNVTDFSECIAVLYEGIEGGCIDTYKLKAANKEEALKKAAKYYYENGWKHEGILKLMEGAE